MGNLKSNKSNNCVQKVCLKVLFLVYIDFRLPRALFQCQNPNIHLKDHTKRLEHYHGELLLQLD
ncbi:MAG: hypothetical protein ACTSPQ_18840 [Candidatus Helarchaeota archaeon]